MYVDLRNTPKTLHDLQRRNRIHEPYFWIMTYNRLLVLYFLGIFTCPGLAVECWTTSERMPLSDDCHDLVNRLALAARDPEKNLLKTWGFMLEDGRRTAKLPKRYLLHYPARHPKNHCAIKLDAIIEDPTATDHFRLGDAVWAAHRVLSTCLVSGKSGEEYPGYRLDTRHRHRVWARLEYHDDLPNLTINNNNNNSNSTAYAITDTALVA